MLRLEFEMFRVRISGITRVQDFDVTMEAKVRVMVERLGSFCSPTKPDITRLRAAYVLIKDGL